MVQLQKEGTPTVGITTTRFVEIAKYNAAGLGVADAPFVVVPHPFGGIPVEQVRAYADAAFEDIINTVTKRVATDVQPVKLQPYPARSVKVTGTIDDVNDLAYKNGWTDGLPIIPPTRERVERMLAGTSRKPGEVVGLVPPRMGAATVEVIAINAVMAGAKPEYLPVIIAAVEEVLRSEVNLRSTITTTAPRNLGVFVSGPIIKEIGVQYEQGALIPGPRSRPNATIGRALNRVVRLVGGSLPPPFGSGTMTTQGGVGNYTLCFGENEDALPDGWDPLRVDFGFSRDDSAVFILRGSQPIMQNNHEAKTAIEILNSTVYRYGATLTPVDGNNLILFGPEHAATLAQDSWSKTDVKRFVYEYARVPLYKVKGAGLWETLAGWYPKWVREADDPNSMIPVFLDPSHIHITVCGGNGKHSQMMTLLGAVSTSGQSQHVGTVIHGATLSDAGR